MAEIESEYKPWKSSLFTILLLAAVSMAIILNFLFLFVYSQSKKLRRAPNLFLLNLAVIDIICAVFWIIPAMVSSLEWEWKFGGYCKFHGFLGMLCLTMNMYTLTVIAFEKFLKIWFPSRHSDAFHNYTITTVVMVSLWIASIVVSFMPLIGWGKIQYFEYQLQCVTDFVESASHLNFFFVNAVCIPLVSILVLYILTFVRIKILQKKGVDKDGKIILETKKDAPCESFAARLRKQEDIFKYTKPKESMHNSDPNEKGDKLYKDDESEEEGYRSDENEIFHDYEEYQIRKREREMARRRRKVYAFRQQYLFMAITMFIVSMIFIGLWMPFFIITYTWVYDPKKIKEDSYLVFSALTFFSVSYKPLVYLINKHIRACVKQAFSRRKKQDNKQVPGVDYIAKYGSNDGGGGQGATPPASAKSGEDAARPRSRGVERNDISVDDFGEEVEL